MRKYKNIDRDDALNDCEASERVNSFCKYMEIDPQDYGNLVKKAFDDGVEDFELVALVYDVYMSELVVGG